MKECLVVIPTYNEASTAPVLITSLLVAIPGVNILIVDDGSPDGTGELCDEIAREDSRVQVLHRQEKQGLGAAYLAGFSWGLSRDFSHIAEMDADGSHRPADLVRMLEFIKRNPETDLIIGSRWVQGGGVEKWTPIRKFLSLGANKYSRFVLRSSIRDLTAGFRVYKTSLLKDINLSQIESQGYCFQIEMALSSAELDAKIVEIPIIFLDRSDGISKMSMRIVFEAMLRVTVWGLFNRFTLNKHA